LNRYSILVVFAIALYLGCGKSQENEGKTKGIPSKIETLVSYEHTVGIWHDRYTTGVFKVTAKVTSAQELTERELGILRAALGYVQIELGPHDLPSGLKPMDPNLDVTSGAKEKAMEILRKHIAKYNLKDIEVIEITHIEGP